MNYLFASAAAVAALVLPLACIVAIGVYVYRDASRRGMNAALWALVVVLAPAFTGVVVYLLARGGYSDLRCPACSAQVGADFARCPACGAKLQPVCPACGRAAQPAWSVCPYCGDGLEGAADGVTPPLAGKDRTVLVALVAGAVVLVLLLGLLAGLVYTTPGASSSFMSTQCARTDHEGTPRVIALLDDFDSGDAGAGADGADALVLVYRSPSDASGGDRVTKFLVYVPGADDGASADFEVTREAAGLGHLLGDRGLDVFAHVSDVNERAAKEGHGLVWTVEFQAEGYANLTGMDIEGSDANYIIQGIDFDPDPDLNEPGD